MTGPLVYRVPAVAELLDVCEATIYRLIHRGELGAVKVGSTYRITRIELERYITEKGASC